MSTIKGVSDLGMAYQRWEPAALDRIDSEGAAGVREVVVQMPTAADLEAIHQQAHEEGYQAGFTEGAEAARQQREFVLAEEVRQLRALTEPLSGAIRDLEQSMADELLGLSLEIARQMLRQAIRVKPELVLPVVRGAMESLPQNTPHPHLHLHPEDAALVRAGMQAEIAQGGWKIVEDQRVTRGGCRIETPVSETDATVENRWKRVAAALGQDSSWLDE